MPKGTKVEEVYSALLREGHSKESAARIAQWQTGEALATGKPPKHKAITKDDRIEMLRRVGEWAEPQVGRMPGYGEIYFANPQEAGEDYRVWYVGGDGDEDSFIKECRSRLEDIPDVEVRYEAEAYPPNDGRWTQVYPVKKSKSIEDASDSFGIGKAIVAVDLHGTIGEKLPGNGEPDLWGNDGEYDPAGYAVQPGALEALQAIRDMGHEIGVWTCWNTEDAKSWLEDNHIPFDWVNEEGPDHGSVKVDADAYIDDKAEPHRGDWADTLRRVLPRLNAADRRQKMVRIVKGAYPQFQNTEWDERPRMVHDDRLGFPDEPGTGRLFGPTGGGQRLDRSVNKDRSRGTCKPGQTQARTGCTPAGDSSGRGKEQGSEEEESFSEGGSSNRKPPGSQLAPKVREQLRQKGMVGTFPPADVPLDRIKVHQGTAEELKFKPLMQWDQTTKSGRISRQYRYTQEFHDRNAAQKFERVMAVEPHLEQAKKTLQGTMEQERGKPAGDAAAIASIIMETGLRPTDGDDSIKHGHYGIASLLGKHVKIKGNQVELDFIGKEGVRNRTTISDPTNVAYLANKVKNLGPEEELWTAGSDKAGEALKEAVVAAGGPQDVKLKDLRTIKATQTARQVVSQFQGPPPPLSGNEAKDAKVLAKAILAMSGEVSKVLNNTPTQARDNYIHPEVWKQWQEKLNASSKKRSFMLPTSMRESWTSNTTPSPMEKGSRTNTQGGFGSEFKNSSTPSPEPFSQELPPQLSHRQAEVAALVRHKAWGRLRAVLDQEGVRGVEAAQAMEVLKDGFTGERRDRRGHRICYQDGKRVACARPEGDGGGKQRPSAEEREQAVKAARDHLKGLLSGDQELIGEHADALKDMLVGLRRSDITELKRDLGLKGSGAKEELARKIAARALGLDFGRGGASGALPGESMDDYRRRLAEALNGRRGEGFGGKRGRRTDGQESEDHGGHVAEEAGGPGHKTDGRKGTDAGVPVGPEAAKNLSRVTKKLKGFAAEFRKRGMEDQAGWMDEFREHVETLGVHAALESLGEEKETREGAEKVQYVGAYDSILEGDDPDSQFTKRYLEKSGIVLAGQTIDPNLSVISSWSRGNIKEEGRLVPEQPGGYVPTDQTFANKLEESQHLPGLESTEDISKLIGRKVTHLTPEVTKKFDEKYGKGQWIVKSYGEEAYAGFGIFFPQRANQIRRDARALMSEARGNLGAAGFKIAKKEGKVIGVSKGGKTYAVGTEEFGKLGKRVQQHTRQAVQASHAYDGAALPSSPEDSIRNDYGISLIRDKEGLPIGITNYDGKQYNFDSPGYKKIADLDGGAAGYAVDRALEADEWRRQGYSNEPKFMVQPAFKAVGVSDYDRAMGNTWETAKEGRVHCVTRNGKASAVPYATLVGRGDALPAVFHSDDTRAMEKAVEEAINQLPESERTGQMYAPDVMKTKDGWKVLELNPSAVGGGSDWLGRNPFVIDAMVSHLTGREPQHARFMRDLLKGHDVELPGLPTVGQGKPGEGGKSWHFKAGDSRGKPCKQGQSAARSGCIPNSPGHAGSAARTSTGAYARPGSAGSHYKVRHGPYEAKYSLHTDAKIAGPHLPLKNYKQQDDHSCGFVAALTLSRYFDPSTPAKDVLAAVKPTKGGGVSGAELRQSLSKLGVDTELRKDLTVGELRRLVQAGKPVLVTVYPEDWSSDHWTVVQGFGDDRIYLTNHRSMTIKEFKDQWFDKGEGLVCRPRKS